MSAPVCIVDFGVGNRRSVEKALAKAGVPAVMSSSPETIESSGGIVLPGVGAFPAAMERIKALGLDVAIRNAAAAGTPILGACLGLQLLFDRSEELGGADGLGLIAGEVVRLNAPDAKLPHIGWSPVQWTGNPALADEIPDASSFYHVHSFVAIPRDINVVVGWSEYGNRFASVVAEGNVFGVQFHPEKSSTLGLRMLHNFGNICERASQ